MSHSEPRSNRLPLVWDEEKVRDPAIAAHEFWCSTSQSDVVLTNTSRVLLGTPTRTVLAQPGLYSQNTWVTSLLGFGSREEGTILDCFLFSRPQFMYDNRSQW
ncbi:hypothetical protein ED733_001197 [Metarhizium rileyi]|uniref:Uncharacterized protein n=1 Tax=Metarhizium rileyi (strain RCEF 4871) TaxID=1649241 RepID=A0A5C6G2Z9_METRR|nr:hypothetical protein ED733_001197 [Metarhizium rileyi]